LTDKKICDIVYGDGVFINSEEVFEKIKEKYNGGFPDWCPLPEE